MRYPWIPALLLFLLFVQAPAQQQTPSFTLSVQGNYTWSFALGIGDRDALRRANLTPWVPSLRQGFNAAIDGKALDIITIKAKLDSSRGVAFQDFGIFLDAEHWKGVLGNFSLGSQYSFAVPRRTLLGAKLSYLGEGFRVEGLASRSLGTLEVRVFRGERGHMEREFYLADPNRPWEPVPYRVDLRGLYYFPLPAPYVPDFTEVKLTISSDEGLWRALARYGLGYLREIFEEDPERDLDFKVIRDAGADVLLLRNAPKEIAKGWIEDAIRAYNDEHALSGDAEKRYPFVPGSILEEKFLGEIVGFISLSVNGEEHALNTGRRFRYLDLGAEDIVVETLELAVRLPGEDEFSPLPLGGPFSFRLFPEAGILRVDFPEWFFDEGAALKASFDYSAQRTVFLLSPLSGIVPDSERVTRNGKRLRRGQDYAVDYEGGILQLFAPLKEGEELRVEYEVPHGLGTGPQEDFLGFSISLGKGTEFFVFRSAESVQMTPTTPLMPNDHTVAGLRLSGSGESWDYSLIFGGSVNVFPPGKNERIPGPNRITDIAAVTAPDGVYTVFSHLRGISVFHEGVFSAYREGRRVRDLLYMPEEGVLLLAEGGTVTVVDLSRSFPFDWRESYTELHLYREGLGGSGEGALGREALALAADGTWVYVATERGVIRLPRADLRFLPEIAADEERWRAWKKKFLVIWLALPAEETPTALVATAEGLYLGTDRGLYLYHNGTWESVAGITGPVHALLYLREPIPDFAAGLYAATSAGVVAVRDGTGEIVEGGREALSLAVVGNTLYYGTENGLYGPEGGPLFGITAPVTALEGEGAILWVGSEATGTEGGKPTTISLWEVDLSRGAVTEYPATVNRVLPTDPGRFRDIPPEGNTDRGVLAQFTWSEHWKGGNLRWYVRTSTPGYEPIDRPSPGDDHNVGFSLSQELEGLSLSLQGSVGMRELFSHPITNVQGSLSLAWSPGPAFDLQISPRIRGLGTPNLKPETSYALGFAWTNPEREPGKGLLRKLTLRLAGGMKGEVAGSGGTVKLQAVMGPFGPLTLGIQGQRPFLFGGEPRGRESVSADLSGDLSFAGIRGKFGWHEDWSRDLGPFVAGGWRFSRKVSYVLKFVPIDWGDWEFRPSLSLAFDMTPAEARFSFKGSPSLGYSSGGKSGRLTLGFELICRSASRTGALAYSASLTPRWALQLPSLLRLELSASLDGELLVRPGVPEPRARASLKKISCALTPLIWEGLEPRMVLTYTPGKLGFSLPRTPFQLGGVTLEGDSRFTWTLSHGDVEGEVKLRSASLPLGEDWSLNLEGGYLLLIRGKTPKQGVFLRGNLLLSFSF